MKLRILDGWKCANAMRLTRAAGVWMALFAALALACPLTALSQTATGGIRGEVADPTGAVIPGALVVVRNSSAKLVGKTTCDATGAYAIHGLPPGAYSVWVTAPGFAAFRVPSIFVAAGAMRMVNPTLSIEVQQQQVQVTAQTTHVSTSPSNNASAMVIEGKDLNALSNDPDELQNELEALAGPSAGPNGGEIYIDGFTGGELPPKEAIQRIVIDRNPFSAEFDRLGYGRIEIFTKPGTGHIHGGIFSDATYSAFNSQDPLLSNIGEPPYYTWMMHGDLSGPISKEFTYFLGGFGMRQQNENIILAANPATVTVGANGVATATNLNEAYGFLTSRLDISPRFDFQLGKANTISVRWDFHREASTNAISNSGYQLPSQATTSDSYANTLQISDNLVISKNLLDTIRFQYRRPESIETSASSLPAYSIAQQFNAGGNPTQSVEDHQNDFQLQNYFSGDEGNHSLTFGGWLRIHDDANSTTSGSNGSYTFTSLNNFATCYQSTATNSPAPSTCSPQQYSYTHIVNPLAKAVLLDAALFYQDDCWFFNRFTVPNGFGSQVPYLMPTIHENGINEQQYLENPTSTQPIPFYQYATQEINASTPNVQVETPTVYTIAPNFHAANDMEGAIGIDQQLTKKITSNVTYIYTQGVHQFFTDNMSAAQDGQFPLSDAQNNIYPSTTPVEPTSNDLQFQSGGVYKESQVMVSVRAMYQKFSFFTTYTYTHALGDTSGVGTIPSVSNDPGLDYGRTTFDIEHRFMLFGNFTLPWRISISPIVMANSGTPYNITIGSDLTGNNQFNARPTYASSCTETYAVSTQFGCLDTDPIGTKEKIIPYGLGTGPVNVAVNMFLSKVIGIGPKIKGGMGAGGFHHGPHGLGGGGLSGSRGGPGPLSQQVPRKYSLTLGAWVINLLNHENFGTPNGSMGAQYDQLTGATQINSFFAQSQTLAGGFFRGPTSGNRSIFLNASFNF